MSESDVQAEIASLASLAGQYHVEAPRPDAERLLASLVVASRKPEVKSLFSDVRLRLGCRPF